jgi:hypothetical protein
MSRTTEGPLEFADLRLRARTGMPAGLARARLIRAGGMDCIGCGQPSRRSVDSLPCCLDQTCGLLAKNKAEYQRMTRTR